ncbi:MAG: amino-acid N-acetyltransferase [Gammaproteobacteria bacterium]|nr:MAG: amino-acid N-acetyltransferase [Gammaproteobacteria bacterium]
MSDYVKFLRDTSPYINAHRGKTFVLAISGEGLAHANFTNIVHDIALLHSLGIRLVLVHGARHQIEERLANCAIEARFDSNTRITDSATMACVKDAVGSARITIEAHLSTGAANSPMHGARIRVFGGNLITAKPLGVRDGIDFHHTGEVRRIDQKAIQKQLDDGALVLLSPVGYSPTGEAFNLNYEDIATQAAVSLGAEKLVMFSAENGISDYQGNLVKMLSLSEVPQTLTSQAENIFLQRSLLACYQACENGVMRSHIISYADNGALLTELFTREGSGTLILKNGKEIIRQATIDDVGGLLELIEPLEQKGILVKRSRELLETEINRFMVMQHAEGTLVGCAALYPFSDGQSAELACVATHPDFQNRGFASRLLAQLEMNAHQKNIRQLFVLTTHASDWFKEKGFVDASLEELPAERKNLYNFQRKSRIFCKNLP